MKINFKFNKFLLGLLFLIFGLYAIYLVITCCKQGSILEGMSNSVLSCRDTYPMLRVKEVSSSTNNHSSEDIKHICPDNFETLEEFKDCSDNEISINSIYTNKKKNINGKDYIFLGFSNTRGCWPKIYNNTELLDPKYGIMQSSSRLEAYRGLNFDDKLFTEKPKTHDTKRQNNKHQQNQNNSNNNQNTNSNNSNPIADAGSGSLNNNSANSNNDNQNIFDNIFNQEENQFLQRNSNKNITQNFNTTLPFLGQNPVNNNDQKLLQNYNPTLASGNSFTTPDGRQGIATPENTIFGIPGSSIPPGHEDLYILKSQVVPPVCPQCPSIEVNESLLKEKCRPCPPCARCPEPNFTCEKVPNYSLGNQNQFLPMPILNDFSTFGS